MRVNAPEYLRLFGECAETPIALSGREHHKTGLAAPFCDKCTQWVTIRSTRYYDIRRRRVPVAESRGVPDPPDRSGSLHLP